MVHHQLKSATEVGGLIRSDGMAREKAGMLDAMRNKFSLIQNAVDTADVSHLPPLRVTVLRNVMIEPLETYLKYQGLNSGFAVDVQFGGYDTIMQDALAGGLIEPNTDAVFVFARLENMSWALARDFHSLSSADVASEIERIGNWVDDALRALSPRIKGIILWHGFETPVHPAGGILDSQAGGGHLSAVRALNEGLRKKIAGYPNAYFVDMDLCLMRLGSETFYDDRYWHIGRAPYSRAALAEVAAEDFKFLRAAKGKSRKCLVLDCDNTLWGGVIGEDGMAGIKLSITYPGSPFYEFQQEIINLHRRGIIVAICSKNNEDDALEVIRDHPDMLLREEHIATMRINWEDKATNIQRIAADLNIGLDSLVFVDDSAFEINLIRETLPEVATIHLPPGRTTEYASILRGCCYFDALQFTEEDRQRTAMYKAEAARNQMCEKYVDLKEYYRSLEMEVDIFFADGFTLPRVAQLVQKTNQFNLTTIRHTQEQLSKFAENDSADVICLKLRDKFGEVGLVGVCVLRYGGGEAEIDTLLMSCRALGREVEQFFVQSAMELAKLRGCRQVVGAYVPTKKNGQVRDFYPSLGFSPKNTEGDKAGYAFVLDGYDLVVPDHYKQARLNILTEGVQ
jgi:FkbH-like protein